MVSTINFNGLRHDNGWVTDQCVDCGFVYDLSQSGRLACDIRERVADVVAILRDRNVDLRSRRQPGVWSPLEYGCHLLDMLLVQRERVLAARRVDRPDCPHRDATSGLFTMGTPSKIPRMWPANLPTLHSYSAMSSPDWPPTTGIARSSTTIRKPANGR